MMITPTVRAIRKAVRAEFAAELADGRLTSGGIYNRRRMRRFLLWSQHAWGNAWDVYVSVPERRKGGAGDRLHAWLLAEAKAGRLDVERIIWRRINHYNHLHVVGDPRMKGTPPKAGAQEDDDMEALKELVEGIQQSLVDAGYDLPRHGVDGDWGPETAAAFKAMTTDAAKTTAGGTGHTHAVRGQTGPVVFG